MSVWRVDYVRHAMSESNRDENNGVHILDPKLVSGEEDRGDGRKLCCTALRPYFRIEANRPTHVALSPLARAVQTMILALEIDVLQTAKVTVLPSLIEQTDWMSDRARPSAEIKGLMRSELRLRARESGIPEITVDMDYSAFEEVEKDEDWIKKDGPYAPHSIIERAKRAREDLREWAKASEEDSGSGKAKLAVLGHSGFVNFLIDDYSGIGCLDSDTPQLGSWPYGAIGQLILSDVDENNTVVRLEETRESRKRRGRQADGDGTEVKTAQMQRDAIVKISRRNATLGIYRTIFETGRIPEVVAGQGIDYLLGNDL
ncbi:Uu.00g065790.m01.CDS01 [Anthostomella pinea]|uniref:Uu.00g065790.m01.CDS01 n=1 Tax=Anthostomella pinea TaxID=933095 RepID=A0AAI8YN40_9PEZI|nr:Uu.00g065790.m01.CDS01 [Anthostomella pinea]